MGIDISYDPTRSIPQAELSSLLKAQSGPREELAYGQRIPRLVYTELWDHPLPVTCHLAGLFLRRVRCRSGGMLGTAMFVMSKKIWMQGCDCNYGEASGWRGDMAA